METVVFSTHNSNTVNGAYVWDYLQLQIKKHLVFQSHNPKDTAF